MATPTNSYSSLIKVALGHVPQEIGDADPVLYQELLDLHNAIEAILIGLTDGVPGIVTDHDNLTDVTPDQHHDQLHDLTSHTDVDLTGIPSLQEGHGLFYDADNAEWRNRAGAYETWPTGLANGGELNIVAVTDVQAIGGLAAVVNGYSDPFNPPTLKGILWPDLQEAITAAPAVAGSIVWIAIRDTGVPAVPPETGGIPLFVGEIVQYAQPPNPTLAREQNFLGILLHNGVEWKEVSNPKVINQSAETLREVLINLVGPSTIIQGGEVSEAASFTLDQAAGTIWENNRNWHVDKSDPNREALAAQTPISFQYVTQDFGDVETPTPTVDPSRYDDGSGSPVSVGGPANNTTIQRLYLDPAGNYWVLWGQFVYPNLITAFALLGADSANSTIPFILQNSILLGYLVVERAKNDWDNNEAIFVPAGTSAGGASGGGTPITDHDNLNGITPNNHHNQAHLLYGPDQTDVDTTDTLEIGDTLMWDGAAFVPVDSLGIFVAAGYGGVDLAAPVGMGDLGILPRILPADTAIVTVPRFVTQDVANDAIALDTAGVWIFNIVFVLTHNESNGSRQIVMQSYDITDDTVLQSTIIPIARNQPGTTFSVSHMLEITAPIVGDLIAIRLDSTDSITGITVESYQLTASLVSNLLVLP